MPGSPATASPRMSIVLPTRERGFYLEHALRSCTRTPVAEVEILVLDNASTDGTKDIVGKFDDPRIRYVRSDIRLSMRDNFERGLEEAKGGVICMLGDDDAVLPSAPAKVLSLIDQGYAAVSCHRSYYGWPDLASGRRDIALVPREHGITALDSRDVLRNVLDDADYYKLPILYHGFVKREPVEKIRGRQGRFFLSNNTDIYSAIALSMEGLRYAFSAAALVVNGASSRSNGASHYGGAPELEKQLWKKEDDLGFLPGFEDTLAVDAAIVETALRYCDANGRSLGELFARTSLVNCIGREVAARRAIGRPDGPSLAMMAASGVDRADIDSYDARRYSRVGRLLKAFRATMPINMAKENISDIDGAARKIDHIVHTGRTGYADRPLAQVMAGARLAKRI